MPDFNKFQGPIPGQSLTDEVGAKPWEHQPQFTKPEEAMDFLLSEVTRPRNLKQMLVLMHNKVPVEMISKTLLFGGFTAGKWSPDLMVLLAKPTMQMLAALGDGAGIDVVLGTNNRYEDQGFQDLVGQFASMPQEEGGPPPAIEPVVTPQSGGGLMAPPVAAPVPKGVV